MFAVVDRWRVAPEDERQFILAWQDLTDAMRRACRSYGSQLHRGPDETWFAYARWPDAAARAHCRHGQGDALSRLRHTGQLIDEWTGEIESELLSEERHAPPQGREPAQSALAPPIGPVTCSVLFMLPAAEASGAVTSFRSALPTTDDRRPTPSPEALPGQGCVSSDTEGRAASSTNGSWPGIEASTTRLLSLRKELRLT